MSSHKRRKEKTVEKKATPISRRSFLYTSALAAGVLGAHPFTDKQTTTHNQEDDSLKPYAEWFTKTVRPLIETKSIPEQIFPNTITRIESPTLRQLQAWEMRRQQKDLPYQGKPEFVKGIIGRIVPTNVFKLYQEKQQAIIRNFFHFLNHPMPKNVQLQQLTPTTKLTNTSLEDPTSYVLLDFAYIASAVQYPDVTDQNRILVEPLQVEPSYGRLLGNLSKRITQTTTEIRFTSDSTLYASAGTDTLGSYMSISTELAHLVARERIARNLESAISGVMLNTALGDDQKRQMIATYESMESLLDEGMVHGAMWHFLEKNAMREQFDPKAISQIKATQAVDPLYRFAPKVYDTMAKEGVSHTWNRYMNGTLRSV